jgi:two-component system nitrate/nitrite sensor histidine kinase NarX
MIELQDLFTHLPDDAADVDEVRSVLIDVLFERMPVGIAIIDRELKLAQCNTAWLHFVERYAPLSIDLAQVRPGVKLFDLFPRAKRRFSNYFDEAFGGKVVREEAVRLEHEGIVSYWDMMLTPLARDGAVSGVVNIVIDASDRVFAYRMLEEREAQYRSIFEASSDGLIIQKLNGAIIESNPAACELYGYTYDEFIGMEMRAIVHPAYYHLFEQSLEQVKAGAMQDTQMVTLCKNGQSIDVEVRATSFMYRGSLHMLSVVRDVTERVRAYQRLEQAVAERTRELSTLLQVSMNIAETQELKPLLHTILEQVKEMIEYSGAAIYLLDDEDELELWIYTGPIPQDKLKKVWRLDDDIVAGEVIHGHSPMIIADVNAESPLAKAYRKSDGANIVYTNSWMGVPLVARQRVIGMLTFDHVEAGYYRPHHSDLGMMFANQAAIAIENARLRDRVKEAAIAAERNRLARELHDAVTQTLFSASLIADVLPRLWERNADEGERRLTELRQLTRGALAEMRTLLMELRPSALSGADLGDLLQQLCDGLSGRARIPVSLTVEGQRTLSPDVKIVFYRVAQESMNNIFKHASASEVFVRLEHQPDVVTLSVSDNGSGFNPERVTPEHMGLNIMRERIDAIGGVFDLESQFEQGTRIRVMWREYIDEELNDERE